MRRLISLLLVLALVPACLTACGAEPAEVSPSQTPTPTPAPVESRPFALGYDPEASLHPINGESQVNLDLAALVYEGLFRLDNEFQALPVLAQSAETDETGLIWTVALREGVVFSDGTPLTADHVVFSLDAARKSSLYAARLEEVSRVRAVDGRVQITLAAPNGGLPALLDIPVVLEQKEGLPLGTGRYRFVPEGEALSLWVNVNRGGWDKLPYDTIPLRAVSSADRWIAAFDSGEVTAVTTDFTSPYALGYSGSYEVSDFPTTNLLFVGFNSAGGLCSDPLVRRACSMAFDRMSVAESLLSGHADAASLPIAPGHRDYDGDSAALLDYDIQGAAALLEQAGFALKEDGQLYRGRRAAALTMVVNSDNTTRQAVAEYLADSLSGLGFAVTVEKLSWDNYMKALEQKNFDLYIGEVRLTADFDLTALLTGELNYGGFESEAVPALLAQWKATEGAARGDGAAQLWAALAAEVPMAPLCFKKGSLLVRWGMVSNLQPTRNDPFFRMEEWITT